MKTLFYLVSWDKEIENSVKTICNEIDCECAVYPVFGVPASASAKEIWFCVKEKDVNYVKRQMNI